MTHVNNTTVQPKNDLIDVNTDDQKDIDNVKDTNIRKQWKKSSKCEIYSQSQNKWFSGTVIKVVSDNKGEMLLVAYRTDNKEERTKSVDRYSPNIRPIKQIISSFFSPKPFFGDDDDLGILVINSKNNDDDNKVNTNNNDNDDNDDDVGDDDDDDDDGDNADDYDDYEQECCIIDDNGKITTDDYSLRKDHFKDWTINKIIQKSNFSKLLKINKKKFNKNTAFWKFIYNKYTSHYTDIVTETKAKVKNICDNNTDLVTNMSFDEISAIYLYTTDTLYRDLNKSLRKRSAEWSTFCGPLLSGLSKLPFVWNKTLYRGIKSNTVKKHIKKAYKAGAIIRSDGFTSSSDDLIVAQQFAGHSGCIYEIENGFRGRDIAPFSFYKSESEILFNISSHFLIREIIHDVDNRIHIKCKELPFPWDNKTILWVDDQPDNNKILIEKFEKNGIMIIPRISTYGAIEFLDFISDAIDINTFNQFRIITDMKRYEWDNDDKTKNKNVDKQAGITLIVELRKRKYNNVVCIYTGYKDSAINKCKAKGIYDDKVIVATWETEVEKYAQFS